MSKVEFAPAKINLTLEVLGRRSDGYHELRSLVAFASDIGDRLTLFPGPSMPTEASGPFAVGLQGSNLVDAAIAAVSRVVPSRELGRIELEKNLPVASGIGGGSADAAAALRLLRLAHPEIAELDLTGIAQELGADVPVCLQSRAATMTGIGEDISPTAFPGDLFVVLANPLVPVPAKKTAEVFRLLNAQPLAPDAAKESAPVFSSVRDVFRYAALRGNALEAPARQLIPEINAVVSALAKLPRSRAAQLSGAGPTCFALFETEHAAKTGARILKSRQPQWWVAHSRLV
ncbi:4-(cytidine 5'-diphospho)-2-C-methyl-D-erythritol kinase [Hyphomicrobium sp.]|uniref:4-(cytidine 5'-diphospho)-2-C-methyl-D-erythritol kinase n=1 Tax=Hyphomicrobium sp. TaxID=82 RepID=UPI000F9A4A68|nr:4-(cytidine 5'-diphospho)-2-C-methyl-D-erythritol kinase [Hyphomicrobium sp.]RUO97287.1 MAG: 4-(cytidine 5'-diphospho)-2-C-methyl-D-erythritol kinase [Hyphomicrobium sp.]